MSEQERHDWWRIGGAAGYEYYRCGKCQRGAIPTVFGFIWPWPSCGAVLNGKRWRP